MAGSGNNKNLSQQVINKYVHKDCSCQAPDINTPSRCAKEGLNIALGVSEHLDEFAKSVGGSTCKTWGTKDFQSQFLAAINNAANKIHFNLDNISSPLGVVSEGAMGMGASRATSLELYQLYSNSAALQRAIFYQAGKIVANPFH